MHTKTPFTHTAISPGKKHFIYVTANPPTHPPPMHPLVLCLFFDTGGVGKRRGRKGKAGKGGYYNSYDNGIFGRRH